MSSKKPNPKVRKEKERKISDAVEYRQEAQEIFWIIDTSGSMQDSDKTLRNSALDSFEDIMDSVFKKLQHNQVHTELRYYILLYGNDQRWIANKIMLDKYKKPKTMRTLKNIKPEGLSQLGAAINAVTEKFKATMKYVKEEEQKNNIISYRDAIMIFVTDGGFTDDWKAAYDELIKINYGRKARKYLIKTADENNRESSFFTVFDPANTFGSDKRYAHIADEIYDDIYKSGTFS